MFDAVRNVTIICLSLMFLQDYLFSIKCPDSWEILTLSIRLGFWLGRKWDLVIVVPWLLLYLSLVPSSGCYIAAVEHLLYFMEEKALCHKTGVRLGLAC